MLIKTDAFVLKSRKYQEADSILVLFSRKLGKISAIAKGSRRAKSKMLAGIQPFTHSHFLLYQGRQMYTVNQVEARNIFYSLREDYRKLTYAAYLVELVETEITEGQTQLPLYQLFGKALTLLSREQIEMETLIRAFELHYMKACGYEPQLFSCADCQSPESDRWRFSASQGGVLCDHCKSRHPEAPVISGSCLRLARYLSAKDIPETVGLRIHPRLNEELKELNQQYLLYHTGRYQFRSLAMLMRSGIPVKPLFQKRQPPAAPEEDPEVGKGKSGLTDSAESDTFNENESS